MTPSEFPTTLTIPVLWGDMDALGHVNNTRYLRWFESARIACFERIGIRSEPSGVGPILATTTCDFLVPVTFPATVVVGARIPRVGNTSFTMEYGVWLRDTLVARGSGVVVMLDYGTGAKVPVPDEIRAAIDALAPRGEGGPLSW